jgi:hypothetical protein
MWVFTRDGFFSAVQHFEQPDTILVRGRVQSDVETLCEIMSTELVENVDADYRYRTIVSRQAWSDYLQQAARELDYSNFKDAMHGVFGDSRRDQAHMDVWSAMQQLQR